MFMKIFFYCHIIVIMFMTILAITTLLLVYNIVLLRVSVAHDPTAPQTCADELAPHPYMMM